jgi:hypothetical protein
MSDYTTKIKEYYLEKTAASYETPEKVALAKECANTFLHVNGIHCDAESTIFVDFACDTGMPFSPAKIGLVLQNLIPHARKIIDTSQAMVALYNQKASNGFSSMHALCLDVTASTECRPNCGRFTLLYVL